MPTFKARKDKPEYELVLTLNKNPATGELKPGVGGVSMRREAVSYPDLLEQFMGLVEAMWAEITGEHVKWVPDETPEPVAVDLAPEKKRYTVDMKQNLLPLASMEARREREMTVLREMSPWGAFLKRLDGMLEDEDYQFAADTLSGIRETVERTCRITPAQVKAVDNIEEGGKRGRQGGSSGRRDGFRERRYEGFQKERDR